jgi:hypothetical protein
MNIINEKIGHNLFGEGKVIGREANVLSVQFSGQVGVKKFIYPDVFEKYLKLHNPDIEIVVRQDLRSKQALIEAEELSVRQEAEEAAKRLVLERSRFAAPRKKSLPKSKVSVQSGKINQASR